MLHILNNLASAQTHGTQHTVDTMTYFLNYVPLIQTHQSLTQQVT